MVTGKYKNACMRSITLVQTPAGRVPVQEPEESQPCPVDLLSAKLLNCSCLFFKALCSALPPLSRNWGWNHLSAWVKAPGRGRADASVRVSACHLVLGGG